MRSAEKEKKMAAIKKVDLRSRNVSKILYPFFEYFCWRGNFLKDDSTEEIKAKHKGHNS